MPQIEELGDGVIIVEGVWTSGKTITVLLHGVRNKPLREHEVFLRWVVEQAEAAINAQEHGEIPHDLADPYGYPLIIRRKWHEPDLQVNIVAESPTAEAERMAGLDGLEQVGAPENAPLGQHDRRKGAVERDCQRGRGSVMEPLGNDARTRRVLRRARRIYLICFVLSILTESVWVVLSLGTTLTPRGPNAAALGASLIFVCLFIVLFVSMARSVLGYSSPRVTGILCVLLCVPLVSIVATAVIDRRLYNRLKNAEPLSARAHLLSESLWGISFRTFVIVLLGYFVVSLLFALSLDQVRNVLQDFPDEVPWLTAHLLSIPAGVYAFGFAMVCLVLAIKEVTLQSRRTRLAVNLVAGAGGVCCLLVWTICLFAPLVRLISGLEA